MATEKTNPLKKVILEVIDPKVEQAYRLLSHYFDEGGGFDYSKFKKSEHSEEFQHIIDSLKSAEKDEDVELSGELKERLRTFFFNDLKKRFPKGRAGEGGPQDLLEELELGYGAKQESKVSAGSVSKLDPSVIEKGDDLLGGIESELMQELADEDHESEVIDGKEKFDESRRNGVVQRFVEAWKNNIIDFLEMDEQSREDILRLIYEEIRSEPNMEIRNLMKENFKTFFSMLPDEKQQEIRNSLKGYIDEIKVVNR